MTILQWALCGVVCEGIIQRLSYEFGHDTGSTIWDTLGRMGKALVMFGAFALYGYLWNVLGG